jgi:cytidylate kinase
LHYIAASPTASFREKWGDFTGSSPKNRPKLSKMGQSIGSLGDEVGRALADVLAHELADREIILKAAERYGEEIRALEHVTDERPSLRERLAPSRERYLASVEAVIWELASRGRVVLVGRGSPFVLAGVPHVLRVRVTAPVEVRAQRTAEREGLPLDAAAERVRRSDRDRAARVRFLFHLDWDDPLRYHLVLNTAELDVPAAVDVVAPAARHVRFRATPDAQRAVADRCAVAGVRAALLADRETRHLWLDAIECRDGALTLRGVADREERRARAATVAAAVSGVRTVTNAIVIAPDGTLGSTFAR